MADSRFCKEDTEDPAEGNRNGEKKIEGDLRMKKKSSPKELASALGISPSRGLEAVIKAQLISAVLKSIEKHGFTHEELAKGSGLPRSAVTGILSGSLQKVTVDRLLRLVEAAGLTAELRVKEAA